MRNTLNNTLPLLAVLLAGLVIHAPAAMAQNRAGDSYGPNAASDNAGPGSNKRPGTAPAPKDGPTDPSTAGKISALEEALRLQKAQLDEMRKAMEEQQRTIQLLSNRLGSISAPANRATSNAGGAAGSAAAGPEGSTAATAAADAALSSPAPVAKPAQDTESPLQFHIGKATITPIGFADFTTVFRTTNTGSVTGTSFGSIPYSNQVQGNLTEFRATAQASRFGFRVDANFGKNKVLGYAEFDFQGNDPANVFVSTNGHTSRMRLYWVDLKRDKWEVLGGQSWSFMTPNRKGLSPLPDDLFFTRNDDHNYQAGLTYSRQGAARVVYHSSNKVAFGVAIENPNQFINNEVSFPAAFSTALGSQFDAANQTTTPNLLPDIIGKVAYDPSPRLHIEGAGLMRTFKLTVVPTGGSAFASDTKVGGGGMVNFNVALTKKIRWISNFYASAGGGRYIGGLAPDVVVKPVSNGAGGFQAALSLVNSYSTVDGIEAQVSPKVLLAAYYGGLYAHRRFFADLTSTATGPCAGKPCIGFGGPNSASTNNRAIQEGTVDLIYTFWKDPKYGALQWIGQLSYLTRSPWFVAPGTPATAHLFMGWLTLRYVLPGSAPKPQ